MKATICKRYSFSAGHYLPRVPGGHPCHRQHGHNYEIDVSITGDVDEHMNWVLDFGVLSIYVKHTIDLLDHQNLNDVPGLENPTAEQIASWIMDRLRLTAIFDKGDRWTVRVWETPKCWAEVSV